jgi:predicted dithiol-disulfide oxidoreductase (DUF899 family)
VSVFYKNEAGEAFHTYSTNALGLYMPLGVNHYLDIIRNERAHPELARRRDEYDGPRRRITERLVATALRSRSLVG